MTAPGLEARSVTMRFGGLTALSEVSLEAPIGRITALIGPNGAGKTTLFNTCCGQLRPTSGTIVFRENDVTTEPPARRALRGLGRTFQRVQLFDSLSVEQNIAMGCEAGLAGSNVLRQVVPRRRDRARIEERVDYVTTLCDIGDLMGRVAGALSTGQRRLVELARTLAGGFEMLLLDEPSSGLDGRETQRFGEILQRVLHERDAGIFLVEHDMGLVMSISAYIYVLDFGELLFEGVPEAVRASAVVRDAYLGVGA